MPAIAELLKHTAAQLLAQLFNELQIPAGPINRIDQVTHDSELMRKGTVFSIETDK